MSVCPSLDVETARHYGEIYLQLRNRGRVLSQVDMMLAALALAGSTTLSLPDFPRRLHPMTRLSRTAFLAALALALAAGAFAATAPAAAPAADAAPPLLDRELFFGNPEIAAAQLSPDGRYVAFLKPWSETRNLWVKKTSEPFEAARRVTAETKRPIPGFFWTRDSRLLLYVKDNDGDENYNVWAVDPAAAKAAGLEVPPSRNLTDAKGARAFIYDVPKKDPDTLYVGLNDRDPAWHDLYKLTVSTGKRELLRENTDRISAWIFDLEGRLRLAQRIADNGDTEILKVDPEGFKTVYTCGVFETCDPDRFHSDGKRVYMQTNKGDVDLTRLVLFDPETGRDELVESDPQGRVDFGGALFAEATDELVGTSYEDERTRVYFRDKTWEADYELLQEKFPGKDIGLDSSTADDRLLLITASSDTDPGERYLFDRTTKKLTLQYRLRERIPRQHMAEMKAVRYASSDGLEIPAFRRAFPLLEQVDKHLDPYEGMAIKLWKRLMIDEMRLHLGGAIGVLREALGPGEES